MSGAKSMLITIPRSKPSYIRFDFAICLVTLKKRYDYRFLSLSVILRKYLTIILNVKTSQIYDFTYSVHIILTAVHTVSFYTKCSVMKVKAQS